MINESLLQPDTPSALDICNAALSKIGEAPLDALIANESTASRLCVLHYHPARRETLCMARWTFATTQTTLDSVSAQAPNSLTPYQFTLPARAGCGMHGMENAGKAHPRLPRAAAHELHSRH